MSDNKPKLGLTSVEAAALMLSEGRTKDPNVAAAYDQGQEFTLDGLHRASLRRAMGFDFKVKQTPNKLHVYTMDKPHLSDHCKVRKGEINEYGHIVSGNLITRLVEACLRLKAKREAVVK